jgi:hypothetical protein
MKTLEREKFSCPFFFQNDGFKLQEVFSELWIRLFIEMRTDLEVFRHFLFETTFPKPFLGISQELDVLGKI